MIDSEQAWSAKTNQAGEWMQLDLGEEKTVIGTVIQPRDTNYQYVTEYTVSTSVDGNTWTEVGGSYDGHGSEIKEHIFSGGVGVRARYVRFIVKTWSGHISLRGDVLIGEGLDDRKIVYAGVAEDKRTYSSVWNNDAIGTGHARSMIDSEQAWSAKTNQAGEWMQLDLGEEKTVIGTVIQPRDTNYQYVTEYTVSTSVDGNTWTEVGGSYDGHGSELKENIFSGGAIVRARYVRFIVKTWSTHISLRGDVLVPE